MWCGGICPFCWYSGWRDIAHNHMFHCSGRHVEQVAMVRSIPRSQVWIWVGLVVWSSTICQALNLANGIFGMRPRITHVDEFVLALSSHPGFESRLAAGRASRLASTLFPLFTYSHQPPCTTEIGVLTTGYALWRWCKGHVYQRIQALAEQPDILRSRWTCSNGLGGTNMAVLSGGLYHCR